MAMNIVDAFMLGHLGSIYVSAASIANALFILPMIFAIGFTVGITPLAGHAHAVNDEEKCGKLLRHAVALYTILGIAISLLMYPAAQLLPYLKQEPASVQLAIPFFNILNFSLIPMMVFLSFSKFTDGLGRTMPAMVASILFNIVNAILNWAMIYGHWGFPAMGMNGSAYATFISRIGMALFMAGYVYYTPLRKYLTAEKIAYSGKIMWELISTGFPIALQFGFEVGAFIIGSLMVGVFGHEAQAAHQLCMNMVATTYMVANGFSSGGTIVISNLYGKKQMEDMRVAGNATFVLALCFMGVCAIFFLLGHKALPSLFNNEPRVVAYAGTFMLIGAFFQLSDGFQTAIIGVLRGISDVKAPMWIAFVSYWVITLPLCYVFAFCLGQGPIGVWYGYLIGLSVAALLLLLRFRNQLQKHDRLMAAEQPVLV